jgi:hypothetical protein
VFGLTWEDQEVLRGVVGSVPVNVVHHLSGKQPAADLDLGHEAVLISKAPAIGQVVVAWYTDQNVAPRFNDFTHAAS